MSILVFDIETVPDTDGGRRLYDLDELEDREVAEIMFHKQRQRSGSEFLRHHLQKIVAISAVLRRGDGLHVWSLGDASTSEAELITRFYQGIEEFEPTLVSWNGSGFDLPVLHYRGLLNGVTAAKYWEVGDTERDFRYNNYLGRFHWRHIDLMDVMAGYQARASAPLDEIAALCGFPGKMGMSGAAVWQHYQDGDIEGIRDYCETDVLNTYLVYQRFQMMRGKLAAPLYEQECKRLQDYLTKSEKPHMLQFLEAWQKNSGIN